jgi:hypothetical protein
MAYLPGTDVRSFVAWVDVNGNPVDPTAPTFTAILPGGTVVTATPVRDALGLWHADYSIPYPTPAGSCIERHRSIGITGQNATVQYTVQVAALESPY